MSLTHIVYKSFTGGKNNTNCTLWPTFIINSLHIKKKNVSVCDINTANAFKCEKKSKKMQFRLNTRAY